MEFWNGKASVTVKSAAAQFRTEEEEEQEEEEEEEEELHEEMTDSEPLGGKRAVRRTSLHDTYVFSFAVSRVQVV